MKRRSNPISLIAIIFIIGVISSFITSDFEFGSLFEGWGGNDIKGTLDYVNLALMFLGLVLVMVFFFFRSAMGKQDQKEESTQEYEELDD